MVQLSRTLSDIWPRFQGHDIFWHWISQTKRAIVIDLDWPLNASSPLSASAELLVHYCYYSLLLSVSFHWSISPRSLQVRLGAPKIYQRRIRNLWGLLVRDILQTGRSSRVYVCVKTLKEYSILTECIAY